MLKGGQLEEGVVRLFHPQENQFLKSQSSRPRLKSRK